MDFNPTIIIDPGSSTTKVGYSGKEDPVFVIPTVVATAGDAGQILVGDDAVNSLGATRVAEYYPLSGGYIQDWDSMNHVITHIFDDKLQIEAASARLMLTERTFVPGQVRARFLEELLEKYNICSLAIQKSALLSLYAQGLLSGIAVDMGASGCEITPVHDGAIIGPSAKIVCTGGRSITQMLIKLLKIKGYTFLNRTADFWAMQKVAEAHCYVAADPRKEKLLADETSALGVTVDWPHLGGIQLSTERFMSPEILFNLQLIDVSGAGISQLLWNSISSLDKSIQSNLARHIVLSGGCSELPGVSTRILEDLKLAEETRNVFRRTVDEKGNTIAPEPLPFRVEDPPRRRFLSFKGASVLADMMKDKTEFWVSRDDWKERGPQFCLDKLNGVS
eukprot:TRINITY_DN12229_c0_g1_i1.p1 TRINITY_DN12229_c0_g1~~TRINITY_DN12229_c0_g1_i1.p1  ORF type:complete len:392 (+),score=47.51 TRINITY_DN12229_c0_g1_i1:1-1176(+)